MQTGLQLNMFTYPDGVQNLARHVGNTAQWAEEIGMDSVWVMDHFFQIPPIGRAELDMLEGYTTLGYMAALTKRVRLGTMVTGVTYRYPGILAKTVTTLDVLSGGRAWFGVGAAWFEREHQGLGVPYPPIAERFERLEETLQIALQMWSSNDGPYEGKHYQLAETLCVPPVLSKPHPPILIGGMGEKKTLRLVAQYAQGCNFFGGTPKEELGRKLGVLKSHCDRLGRNFGEIERTVIDVFRPQEKQAFMQRARDLAALGFDTLIFSLSNPTDRKIYDELQREIIPFVNDLKVAGR